MGRIIPKSIKGIYRSGKVELSEPVADVLDETPVIVTFVESGNLDLQARGIGEGHAADLRKRLARSADDWDSPEIDAYDDYDNAKARL